MTQSPGAEHSGAENAGQPLTLSGAFRARWKRLLWLPFAFAAVGLLYAFIQRPVYESQSTIIFQRESGGAGLLAGLMGGRPDTGSGAEFLSSLGINLARTPTSAYATAVFKSRTSAEEVVEHFHLQDLWHDRDREVAVARLEQSLSVTPHPKEPTLDLTFRCNDPQLAADILNRIIEDYRKYSTKAIVTSAKHVRLVLEEQVRVHRKKLDEIGHALVEFEQVHELAWLGDDAGGRIAEHVLSADSTAQVQLEQVQAKVAAIQAGLSDSTSALKSDSVFPAAAPDPILQSLQAELVRVRLRRDQLRISRTPANLELKAAELEVSNVQRLLAQHIAALGRATRESLLRPLVDARSSLKAAQAQAAATRTQLQKQIGRFKTSSGPHMEYLTLQRKYQIEELIERTLSIELQKALIQEAADSIDIEVLDPPNVPLRPVLPRKGLYAMIGLFIGMLLALGELLWTFYSANQSSVSAVT